jgi:hypothetical protein
MSTTPDGRGLATDDFDDDEIDWDDESTPAEGEGLSPIESLVDAGHDIFDDEDEDIDDDDEPDDEDDRDR